ncbi:MAG: porin, partial [Duodenibacillus sp.]|nr:porin [Duodenibacillus sp.]
MRKSLIALACLSACCTMATAGTVEIYGAVDTYIAVNNNDNGNTSVRMSSGGASASYWGFKGMEEISLETQVMYRLEQAYLSDVGTNAAGSEDKIFSREAW